MLACGLGVMNAGAGSEKSSAGYLNVASNPWFIGAAGPTVRPRQPPSMTISLDSARHLPNSSEGMWFTKETCAAMNWLRYLPCAGDAKWYPASKRSPLFNTASGPVCKQCVPYEVLTCSLNL